MPRITPNTRIGGQDDFERQIVKVMAGLGHFIGLIIFAFTIFMISVDTILNPIFMFAQAKNSGIDVGTPFGTGWLAWWTIVVITICTTGLQYALLQPGAKTWGLGRIVGLIIMVFDTIMDGGGFLSWQATGANPLDLAGDSSHLQWGMFPAAGSHFGEWFAWGAICAICALHEPFLQKVLGMLSFEPAPDADVMSINIGKWVERAGKLLSRIKLVVLSLTPYIMALLDVMLFPQSQRGENGGTQFVWVLLTFVVTAGTLALWRYYNHIRVDGGYKLRDLDRTHQLMFLAAVAVSTIDSFFDLKGFNQALYHQANTVPQDLPPGAIQQWFLTAGIVLLICTAFGPMCSDLFGPVARLASSFPGYDSVAGGDVDFGGDDFGGGGSGGKGDDPFTM